MKAKITYSNVKAYIQGNCRVFLWKYAKWIIYPYIKEQIDMRIISMDQKCYSEGNCQLCGCMTPELQMANKACDKPCYPTMMSYWKWKKAKRGLLFYDCSLDMFWSVKEGKFYRFKDTI